MTHHQHGHVGAPGHEATAMGRRRFITGVGAVAGATTVAASMPTGVTHAALPNGASSFASLPEAVRVADTRSPSDFDHQQLGANHIRVKVAGVAGVPNSATAAVLTVTAGNSQEPNFVTAYPSGVQVPNASNLNLAIPGDVNANLATVKVGSDGSIDVFSRVPCDLIVDILGYYAPVNGPVREGRFVGLSAAQRAIDTRPAFVGTRSFTEVDVTRFAPADASSVVINLTATETTGPSFFTAVPFSVTDVPSTSSLNVVRAGDTRASGVIVPVETVDRRRKIKIFALNPAKLIVDVTGYFTSDRSPISSDGLFVPIEPARLIDTREPGTIGKLWPNWVTEVAVPFYAAETASAIVLNVTGTETRGPGFLTISAARQSIPGTSNVNFSGPSQVVPNHVITPITSKHGFQILSSHGAHVIADFAGYYTGKPKPPTLGAYVNPAPPGAPPTWILNVPRIGLTSTVLSGEPRSITDSGRSWHWTGTGFMGHEGAHVALFAHRTEASAPYFSLDRLQNGDTIIVTTGDRREYTYRMVRRDLTDAANTNILAATRFHPGTTLSLVACTVGHDRSKSRWPDVWAPTSLDFRIIVTAELVSWREF